MIEKVCNKIDDLKHPKKIVALFLLTWLIISGLQAFFTELAHDEAYYWLYSRKLAWGYFDHPPFIAFIIRIGYFLFSNEFGVRFIPLLLGTGTIYIIYLLVKDTLSSTSTLLIILMSVIILKSHVGGFLAIPDIPVIFFSTLFFYVYKEYLRKDGLLPALFLGLIAAAMLYSKYHGVLVLFFTLASNLKLLRRKTFYLIPIVLIVAMLPHLFWQIQAGFPTFEYHLVGRSSGYRVVYTLDYLLGQVLIAGPLIGFLIFVFAAKMKINGDDFYRAMRFNFYGFFGFFLLMTFKGRVEAHWTAIGFIPAIVLSVNSIFANKRALKWLRLLIVPSAVIFLFLRICLVFPLIPAKYNVGAEFHNWDDWAQEIKEHADGRLVVFGGTFQRPAKYSFYTGGEFAHSLNYLWYRKNQFDLWGYTDSIQNKPVALYRATMSQDTLCTLNEECYTVKLVENFKSYYDLPIIFEDYSISAEPGDSVEINFSLKNVTNDTLHLKKQNRFSPLFVITIYTREGLKSYQRLGFADTLIAPGDSSYFNKKFKALEEEVKAQCYVSIVNDELYPGFNGKPFELNISTE